MNPFILVCDFAFGRASLHELSRCLEWDWEVLDEDCNFVFHTASLTWRPVPQPPRGFVLDAAYYPLHFVPSYGARAGRHPLVLGDSEDDVRPEQHHKHDGHAQNHHAADAPAEAVGPEPEGAGYCEQN